MMRKIGGKMNIKIRHFYVFIAILFLLILNIINLFMENEYSVIFTYFSCILVGYLVGIVVEKWINGDFYKK